MNVRGLPRLAWAAFSRRAEARFLDMWERVRGRRDPSLPTRRLMLSVGSSDPELFLRAGDEFVGILIETAGLKPEDRVLDVGCGVGRLAIPLTRYLTGDYEGFDVNRRAIAWCRDHITPQHPNFRFRVADVKSRHYNLRGRADAAAYRFPFDDESFDHVVHTSVFTHLLPEAARNYAMESARVLKPGGACFATFLLIDDDVRQLAEAGELPFDFRLRQSGYWALTELDPEATIGYPIEAALAMFDDLGLSTAVHRGEWRGRGNGLTWQDLVIARTPVRGGQASHGALPESPASR